MINIKVEGSSSLSIHRIFPKRKKQALLMVVVTSPNGINKRVSKSA